MRGAGPWYRQPWPWLLLTLFLAAAGGGVYSIYLASRHSPVAERGGVREGLIVRRAPPPTTAQLTLNAGTLRVTLPAHSTHPDRLYLIAVAEPGETRYSTLLRHHGDGVYGADGAALPAAVARFLLEPADAAWRLSAVPAAHESTLELTRQASMD